MDAGAGRSRGLRRFAFVVAASICGCASAPKFTPEQTEAADCGPYPTDYQALIVAQQASVLRDPTSAQYRFGMPVKGVIFKPGLYGGGVDHFGWVVEYWVNAKNAFGGYAGERHHSVIIRDGVLKGIATQEETDRLADEMTRGSRAADDPYK